MTRITLVRLTLRNFKGIRDLTGSFDSVTEVWGDNATGKTTLFDAFLWLLFDKDSQNRKDFDIKTLDADGKVLPGLDHEVEGVLLVDGRTITLRKVYAEKWVKKRGSATSEFTGHSVDYFVDGVPVKLKEFKDRVAALVDESIFKLLTSPSYFNEQLSWQDRRKILLEVCGDVSDADVIASSGGLSKLPSILNERSIEDHRKVIAARRADINKEIEKIPVRIDEADHAKPDTSDLSETELQRQIDQLRFEVDAKEQGMGRLQNGGEVAEEQKRLAELEGELLQIKNKAQSGAVDGLQGQRERVNNIRGNLDDVRHEQARAQQDVTLSADMSTEAAQTAGRYRKEWSDINIREFAANVTDTCAACGQALPAHEVQAAADKAKAQFNASKSEDLERVVTRGKQAADLAAQHTAKAEKARARIDVLRQQELTLLGTLGREQEKLDEMTAGVSDVTQDPAYIAKQQEIRTVQARIVNLRQSVLDEVTKARTELMGLRDGLRHAESQLAAFDQVRKLDERIAQLGEEERRLAAEYERLEEQMYLTEEFIRTKVQMLESRINSKFCYARFKLFEQQINGGLAETCETLYKGVPYGSGLNNAARINVGLDIINTLSEHYGICAPIFVDNAEAVTQLTSTDSQVVAMYVSERDKTLRIETKSEPVKEAV